MRKLLHVLLGTISAASPIAALADDRTRLVRVTSRVIEVPCATLTGLLVDPEIGGHELHERAVELALAGDARIIDTALVTTRVGSRSKLESIRELIHPSESELNRSSFPAAFFCSGCTPICLPPCPQLRGNGWSL